MVTPQTHVVPRRFETLLLIDEPVRWTVQSGFEVRGVAGLVVRRVGVSGDDEPMTNAATAETAPVAVPVPAPVRDLTEAEVVDLCQRQDLHDVLTEAVWLTRGRRVYASDDGDWTYYMYGIDDDHYAISARSRFDTDRWRQVRATRRYVIRDHLNAFDDGRAHNQGLPPDISAAVRADALPGTGDWASLAVAISVWWDDRMVEAMGVESARMLLELSVTSTTLRHLDYQMIVPTPSELAGGHVARWGPVLR